MAASPPLQPESYADATWGAGLPHEAPAESLPPLQTLARTDAEGNELPTRDLIGIVVTANGAAVLHQTKSLGLVGDCSQAAEEVAASKAAEIDEYHIEIWRALGNGQPTPMLLATDNKAHMQVATGRGAASRSRHLLRRYYTLMQRIQSGRINVVHVPDAENPSDFVAKLRASLAYVTGAVRRPKGAVERAIGKRRAGKA
eukprot:6424880-Prymnesium_polylepis.1